MSVNGAEVVNRGDLRMDVTTAEELNASLLSLLECPVCLNYMTSPITQCSNGHNICSKCIPDLTSCPVCRTDLPASPSRNLFAEKMAEKCIFPCKNADSGCNKVLKLDLMQAHAAKCPYRAYDCLIMDPDCAWKGQRSDLYRHVTNTHYGKAWDTEVVNFKCSEEFGSTVFNENAVIKAHDELFHVSVTWEEGNSLYGTVRYIGEAENAAKYKYRFEFRSDNDKVIYQHVVRPEEEDCENIYETGRCLSMSENIIPVFKKSNCLNFKLSIIKI